MVGAGYWDYETVIAAQEHWPSPVFREKWETDANFERATLFLLENRELLRPAFGSHNIRSLAHAMAAAQLMGLPPRSIEARERTFPRLIKSLFWLLWTIALAVMLLTTAGLAVRTGFNLSAIDLGIRTSEVLTFCVTLNDQVTPPHGARALVDEARLRLRRIAGVEAVHAFETLPVLTNERLTAMGQEAAMPEILEFLEHPDATFLALG